MPELVGSVLVGSVNHGAGTPLRRRLLRLVAVAAVALATTAASCQASPGPTGPPPPRYVPDPPTASDYQGEVNQAPAELALSDVLYVPGGLQGCPTGDDSECSGNWDGDTFNGSHTLDLYLPDAPGTGPLGVIVWIHGGFGIAGDKTGLSDPSYLSDLLARQVERGFAVVTLNYRLNVPEPGPNGLLFETALPPVAAEDVDVAVRFLKSKATEWNIDPQRIVLWGHSWGSYAAQLAATAAGSYTPSWLPASLAGYSPVVAGAIAEAGPSDLPTSIPVALAEVQASGAFGEVDGSGFDPANHVGDSPSFHVDASDSPIYAIVGPNDALIPRDDSELMADLYGAIGRTDLYRLDVVDDSGEGPMPWVYRRHTPHPGANRTQLEAFIDGVRRG